MATTLSSTLTNIEPRFIARARLRNSEKQVFRNFVDTIKQQSGTGRTYNEPIIGRLTAYAGSEGVAVGVAQALADSNAQYVPTEHVTQVVLTKRAIFTNAESIMGRSIELMTDAMATRKDTQITALMDGFDNDEGSASQALLTGLIFQAKANIMANDNGTYGPIPMGGGGQLILAAHPLSMFDVEDDILNFSSAALQGTTPLDAFAAEVFKDGIIGNAGSRVRGTIAGCIVVESQNVAVDSSDDASNAVWARDALVLCESEGIERNTDMTMLSGRAVEITMSEWYVAQERVGTWGREIKADAAAV